MGKEKARVKKAMELALEHLDYIIDHRTAPDFVEVTGRMGGDVIPIVSIMMVLCMKDRKMRGKEQ